MKKEKILNRLAVLVIILALVLTSVLAYRPDILKIGQSSTVYASTVFDKSSIMSVNIIMDDDDWDTMLDNAASEEYYSCDVEINGTRYNNVGIRPKGNTSLSQIVEDDTTDRFSFKLEFDHYVKGQTLDGLDKLCLNNMMSDASYMKEYLSYDILTYLGVNTSLYSYASINLNGDYWGLYFAIEAVEDSFLQRNYSSSDGELYKPETNGGGGGMQGDAKEAFENMTDEEKEAMKERFQQGNGFPQGEAVQGEEDKSTTDTQNENTDNTAKKATVGNDTDTQENGAQAMGKGGPGMENGGGMMGTDLAYTDDEYDSYSTIWDSTILNEITDEEKDRVITALKNITNQENVEQYLDVDQMLRYIAANVVVLNDDSYFGTMLHNYYLYENDGVLSMIPWDYNLAFGGFAMGNSDATELVNRAIDDVVSNGSLEDRPMLAAALSTDEYVEQYHTYLQQLIDGYFTSGVFETTVAQVKEMISSYVKTDPTAFYSYDEYETAVETLEKFVNARIDSIQEQLDGEIPASNADRTGDGYTLVDGSTIKVSDMGTQGGGKGMGGFGEKAEADTSNDTSVNPDNTEQSQDNKTDHAGQMQPPGGMNGNAEHTGPMGMENSSSTSGTDRKEAIYLTAASVSVLLGALLFMKLYRRRKFRTK